LGLALRLDDPRARHAKANQWQQITKQLSSAQIIELSVAFPPDLGAGGTRPSFAASAPRRRAAMPGLSESACAMGEALEGPTGLPWLMTYSLPDK
jgi:hypothetical protein